MKRLFSSKGVSLKISMIMVVGIALTVVVILGYFAGSSYRSLSNEDMSLRGGACDCGAETGNCPCPPSPSCNGKTFCYGELTTCPLDNVNCHASDEVCADYCEIYCDKYTGTKNWCPAGCEWRLSYLVWVLCQEFCRRSLSPLPPKRGIYLLLRNIGVPTAVFLVYLFACIRLAIAKWITQTRSVCDFSSTTERSNVFRFLGDVGMKKSISVPRAGLTRSFCKCSIVVYIFFLRVEL